MFARCEADIVRCSLCTKKFLELLGKLFCDAISASASCSWLGPADEAILDCSLNKPDPLDQEWTQASRLQNRRKVPSVAQSALSCLSLVTIIFREEKFLNFLSAIFSFSYKKVFIFPNHCFKVSRGVRFASACFERKFRVSKCTNFRTRF